MRNTPCRMFFALAGVALLLSGCSAPNAQLRKTSVPPDYNLGSVQQIIPLNDTCLRQKVGDSVTERYKEFTLSFVEFDDQGKFWNKDQQLSAVDRLSAEPGASANGAIILVFIHGWFNNADTCNGNVKLFRKTLLELSEIEQKRSASRRLGQQPDRPSRRVIGVYVGWRGLSQEWQPAKSLSFWARKNTAHKIGVGDMDELLVHLDVLKQQLSHGRSPTRLVTIGHSFGGALLFSSVDNLFKERTVRDLLEAPHRPDGTIEPPLIRGAFGDLVVLVNPAFEALRYSGLAEAAAGMKTCNPLQTTVFMVVGAQNDQATGCLLPIGQSIPAMTQNFKNPAERCQYTTALGHYDDYFTELLDARPEIPAQAERKLTRPIVWKEENLSVHGPDAVERQHTWRDFVPAEGRRTWKITSLPPGSHHPLNAPFMVVSATPAVIDGHSGIYKPIFMEFLRDFIVAQDILKEYHETKAAEKADAKGEPVK